MILLSVAVFSMLQLINSACKFPIQYASYFIAYISLGLLALYLFKTGVGLAVYFNADSGYKKYLFE